MTSSISNIVSNTSEIFNELRNHLHPIQWAFDHPSHSPTKTEITYALQHRGEKGCCTFEREGYKYKVRYLHNWTLQKSLDQSKKLYYVSGTRGRALLYIDIDAHDPWRVAHVEMAREIVNDYLAIPGWFRSTRGLNGYLAVRCQGQTFFRANEVFQELQTRLQYLLARAGCLAGIEVKGFQAGWAGEQHWWKQYGKLPLHADDFCMDKLDAVLRSKMNIQDLGRLIGGVKVDQAILASMKARKAGLSKPIHILLTPEVNDQLLTISKHNWKMAMVSRQLREDGEYIDRRYLLTTEEEKYKACCKIYIKEPANNERHALQRDRRFWSYVKDLAHGGVPEADHLAEFLFMLARPLLFREYWGKDDRVERTIDDLIYWTSHKHNGFISRKSKEIAADVEKVVRRADKYTNNAVKVYWLQVRANDAKYPHRIELLSPIIRNLLTTEEQEDKTCCKIYIKKPDDSSLPTIIEDKLLAIANAERMRKKAGEYPFVRFARRLLNAIWSNQGRAHINLATIQGFLETKNIKQQTDYKKLLARHGLIFRDWERYIRRSKASALYRLTDKTMIAFREAFRQSTQAQTA